MPTELGLLKARLRGVTCALLVLVPSLFLTAPARASPVRLAAIPTVNWSGYALAGAGFTSVTGTFNVPAPLKSISCLEETSVWVGIDGLHNHDLLQAGVAERGFTAPSSRTQTTWPAPGVASILCGGRAQIYAWWEDLPSGPVQVDLPVHVGDSVTVSIFKMSPGWWALVMHDRTAKQSFFLAQRYDGPQTSAEWVVEAPDVMGVTRGPVPFTSVDFHDIDADGQAHGVERFTFGSGRHFASPSGVVASMDQLRRTGFAVMWAVRPIRPVRPPVGVPWTATSPMRAQNNCRHVGPGATNRGELRSCSSGRTGPGPPARVAPLTRAAAWPLTVGGRPPVPCRRRVFGRLRRSGGVPGMPANSRRGPVVTGRVQQSFGFSGG
jgi:hypothetical protein